MLQHALITRGAVVTWPRNFGLDGSRLPFLNCCGCWGVCCCGAVQSLSVLTGAPTSRGCMPGPLLIDVTCAPTGVLLPGALGALCHTDLAVPACCR